MGYTVLSSSGEPIERNLSAEEAATIILDHDGARWEVRQFDEPTRSGEIMWGIWTTGRGGSRPMVSIMECYGWGDTAKIAWPQLALRVLAICNNWRGGLHVLTDQEYDGMETLL